MRKWACWRRNETDGIDGMGFGKRGGAGSGLVESGWMCFVCLPFPPSFPPYFTFFSWWRQASKQAGLAGEPGKQAQRPRGLIECLVAVYDMVRVGMAVWDEWMDGWMGERKGYGLFCGQGERVRCGFTFQSFFFLLLVPATSTSIIPLPPSLTRAGFSHYFRVWTSGRAHTPL
jgi:hypothetical protein